MNSLSLAYLFALVALAVAAPAPEQHDDCKAKMANFTAKCKAELKVSDDDIAAMMKNAPFPPNTKCLIKCVAENFEVFKDGKLDEAKVTAMITTFTKDNAARRAKELQLLNECKQLSGTDACDTAAKMYTCAVEGAKKIE